ncbi:MAG: hypothetical protein ABI692_01015 [Terracoccus sp.]
MTSRRSPATAGAHRGACAGSPVTTAWERTVSTTACWSGWERPNTTADGRYTLAHNGEVYSYRELRTELEGLSRTFATESDTEVVLPAFAEWGAKAFDRFNVMSQVDPGCRRRLALSERKQTDPRQRALQTIPIDPTTYMTPA